jgi:hypothetical protein
MALIRGLSALGGGRGVQPQRHGRRVAGFNSAAALAALLKRRPCFLILFPVVRDLERP